MKKQIEDTEIFGLLKHFIGVAFLGLVMLLEYWNLKYDYWDWGRTTILEWGLYWTTVGIVIVYFSWVLAKLAWFICKTIFKIK